VVGLASPAHTQEKAPANSAQTQQGTRSDFGPGTGGIHQIAKMPLFALGGVGGSSPSAQNRPIRKNNSFFQMGTVFFRRINREPAGVQKAAPPIAGRANRNKNTASSLQFPAGPNRCTITTRWIANFLNESPPQSPSSFPKAPSIRTPHIPG